MTTPVGDPLAIYIANLKELRAANALPDDVLRHIESVNRQAAYWLKQAAKAKPAAPALRDAPQQSMWFGTQDGGKSPGTYGTDTATRRTERKGERAHLSLWES